MKYSHEVEINKPLEKVIRLFDNPDNLYLWMKGLQKFEHLSGNPGEPGAISRLTFKMGNREMVMTETITSKQLPQEFSGIYEAKGVFNIVTNSFEKISPEKTRYRTENEFQFKGFMKIIAFLMPGAFRKQSLKYMEDFKKFAESA